MMNKIQAEVMAKLATLQDDRISYEFKYHDSHNVLRAEDAGCNPHHGCAQEA
jgi:hypothetical protein